MPETCTQPANPLRPQRGSDLGRLPAFRLTGRGNRAEQASAAAPSRKANMDQGPVTHSSDVRDAPLMFAVLGGLVCVGAAGLPLASPLATILACLAILLFGLPHGTLDLEIIKNRHRSSRRRMAGVLLLYIGLGAAMYLLWQAAPLAALAAFLITAVVHFSEDWEDADSPFFMFGLSVAVLTAPSFLYLGEIKTLFVALSGNSEAGVLGDLMLLLAPISLAVSAVALVSYWQSDRRHRAASGGAVLAGMLVLPPAIGFAAFFCLYHSPRHFSAALAHLSAGQFRMRWRFVATLTLAALGLAAWLFTGEIRGELSAQVVAASFMTLSILTLPHMAVPVIVARLAADRLPPAVSSKEHSHADQRPARVHAQG